MKCNTKMVGFPYKKGNNMIKSMKWVVYSKILLFITAINLFANQQEIATAQSYKSISNQILTYLQQKAENYEFSGSVLIARNNTIIVNKGYGYANHELDVLNTPKTKFRIGSITKPFTAIATMQLRERGMLSLLDPLSKYIPDYPNGELITIHHLLSHTSGVANFTDFKEFRTNSLFETTLEEIIHYFKYKPLLFKPGAEYDYSNSNYILLTYIIEKVSQQPYASYVRANILIPAGMYATGMDVNSTILENRASGYDLENNVLINARYTNMSWPQGAGSMYSTVKDLYALDRILYTQSLINKNSLDLMYTPNKGTYCYGWGTARFCNRRAFLHSGGINGFHGIFIRFIDDNSCMILLSNFRFSQVDDMARDLAAILFGC